VCKKTGLCLESFGVVIVDSRDHKGRQVFGLLDFDPTIFPASTDFDFTDWWLFEQSYWPVVKSVSQK
jgi:hypothetical protein